MLAFLFVSLAQTYLPTDAFISACRQREVPQTFILENPIWYSLFKCVVKTMSAVTLQRTVTSKYIYTLRP